MDVSEICKILSDPQISSQDRELVYEEIIKHYGFRKNYSYTIKAKINENLLPIFVIGFFFWSFAVGILMISQAWIILVMFIPFIIYAILLVLCVNKMKEGKIIENYKMRISRCLNKVYEMNYWSEMESCYLKQHGLETIGRPISTKIWPTIAVSTIPSIIFKHIKKIDNKLWECGIAVLMIIVFIYCFQKIACITKTDKLEAIIKEIISYKDNNKDKFTRGEVNGDSP